MTRPMMTTRAVPGAGAGEGRERIPTDDLFVRAGATVDPEVELLVKAEMRSNAEKAEAEAVCPEKLQAAHAQLDAAMTDWREELTDQLDAMVSAGALPALTPEAKAALVDWNLESE